MLHKRELFPAQDMRGGIIRETTFAPEVSIGPDHLISIVSVVDAAICKNANDYLFLCDFHHSTKIDILT